MNHHENGKSPQHRTIEHRMKEQDMISQKNHVKEELDTHCLSPSKMSWRKSAGFHEGSKEYESLGGASHRSNRIKLQEGTETDQQMESSDSHVLKCLCTCVNSSIQPSVCICSASNHSWWAALLHRVGFSVDGTRYEGTWLLRERDGWRCVSGHAHLCFSLSKMEWRLPIATQGEVTPSPERSWRPEKQPLPPTPHPTCLPAACHWARRARQGAALIVLSLRHIAAALARHPLWTCPEQQHSPLCPKAGLLLQMSQLVYQGVIFTWPTLS